MKLNKRTNSRPDLIIKEKLPKSKRSQEEMVGFVLIIVLVTIIVMVFIGMSIKKAPNEMASQEVSSFLQASSRYSTDCYLSQDLRLDIKGLVIACFEKKQCLDENPSCTVLENVYKGMIERAWKPGKDNPVKAYSFRVFNKNLNQTILSLKNGNCTGTKTGSYLDIPKSGQILKVELSICS